jgi:AraC-like DNA-binding protein
MVHSRKNHSVSIGLVKILNIYAKKLGVDFSKVAKTCDFDIQKLNDSEARIPGKLFESMWLKVASLSNDPCPGLNFGRQMAKHYPGGSVLFTMMMNCSTIEKALQVFVRYHRIMADMIQPQFQKAGDVTHLSWEVSAPGLYTQSHLSEALLCTYYSVLNFLSQGQLRPVKVCFTHAMPSDPAHSEIYQHIFRAPILFEENKSELIVKTESLGIKVDLANEELYKVLEQHAIQIVDTMDKEKRWSNKVIALMSDMTLKGNVPDIESVSQKLAVSKRNLQEKLKAEGTSFRGLLKRMRKHMAIDNLAKQDVRICDIAFLLGYSDQSAFNHAFKRWTGQTPKTYLKNSQGI